MNTTDSCTRYELKNQSIGIYMDMFCATGNCMSLKLEVFLVLYDRHIHTAVLLVAQTSNGGGQASLA